MDENEAWRVSRKNPRRVTANGRVVTTTYHSNNGLGVTPLQAVELTRAISDARLIASAPDLRSALNNATEFLAFYYTGPDAERHRSVEGAQNIQAEAETAFRVAIAALARTQEPPKC
jgi:hypothetical protein